MFGKIGCSGGDAQKPGKPTKRRCRRKRESMQSKTYEQICNRCRRVCFSEQEFRDHECFDMNAKIEVAIAQAKQKTLQAGIIIGADDSLLIVRPNAYDFTLEELQGFVGGYIILAILKATDLHGTLVVNENCPHH